ncbi:MAG: hypothetical protein Q4F75_03915 [Pseudomonadota bacterium]|nr:hypothetical protein [Pseudomonadota bacterium]
MKKVFFFAALLLAVLNSYAVDKGDTVRINDIHTKVVISRKTKVQKRYLCFHLEDNRMIEIIDRKKGKKEWGFVYEYNPDKGVYIQCDRFRTNFDDWKKARKNSLIHIRRENFRTVYSLL